MIDSNLPFITIAMPVRNEERFIESTLIELLNQHYPVKRYEIIVADGKSSDRTPEIVKEIALDTPQVRLFSNPGRLPSSGRNIAFRNGRGNLFLVIDGHCRINNKYLLRNIADCFSTSGAQCLGRPQPFVFPEEPTMQRAIALARSSPLGHSSNSHIHSTKEGFVSPVSVGCAYKREVFQKIGFVDESFDACEDVEFNYRVEQAGFKTFFSPKIAVYYYPRKTLSGLWRQLLRYGTGRFNFMLKHKETINCDTLSPVFFLLFITLGPLLGFVQFNLLWIYISVLVLYFFVITIESIRLSKDEGHILTLKLLITFPVIHMALAVGLIRGAVERILARESR